MGQAFNRNAILRAVAVAGLRRGANRGVTSPTLFSRILHTLRSVDFGTVVMNIGSIVSLTGFMMSDVLHLRLLSICGSMCGMTYNLTRTPPQINAVAWSLVFASTNVFKTIQILVDRQTPRLSQEEYRLYHQHFEPMGVTPRQFKKLISPQSCTWKSYKKGDIIVKPGEPLRKVILIHHGEARCEDPSEPVGTRRSLKWKYKAGINGCIIGGTAVVDNAVLQKSYPNRIVSETPDMDCVTIEWDVHKLIEHMNNDKEVEAALLHLLYHELITHFRRERHEKLGRKATMAIQTKLQIYKNKVQSCIRNAQRQGDGQIHLNPRDKKVVREFRMKERITPMQKAAILKAIGWTVEEWHDGMKH